jgi:hypothetical protein
MNRNSTKMLTLAMLVALDMNWKRGEIERYTQENNEPCGNDPKHFEPASGVGIPSFQQLLQLS